MPKSTFKLVSKQELIARVYFVTFQADQNLNFKPGQFFSLEVEPKAYRAYSTVYVGKNPPQYLEKNENLQPLENGEYVSFMISTKPGGKASNYFAEVPLGTELCAVGPSGQFSLVENLKPKIFISTGTGLAPFVSMIEKVLNENKLAEVTVFFGVWVKNDDFAGNFFRKFMNKKEYPNFNIYTVIDGFQKEDLNESNFGGRVTTVIPEMVKDFTGNDFYICGHPAMVADMAKVLEGRGAGESNIFMEKFGK